MHRLPGDRVRKIQRAGVKPLSRQKLCLRVIQRNPGQRMADGLHMNPDLMGAAGLQADGCQGTGLLPSAGKRKLPAEKAPVTGAGRVSAFRIHPALNERAGNSSDGSVDDTGFRQISLHRGQIGAADLPFLKHGGQDGSAQGIFRQNQQAGGIPVQPVDAPEDVGLPLLLKILGRGICQRVVVVALGRVDGHAGRLVHHQKILILIDHGKGKRKGRHR